VWKKKKKKRKIEEIENSGKENSGTRKLCKKYFEGDMSPSYMCNMTHDFYMCCTYIK